MAKDPKRPKNPGGKIPVGKSSVKLPSDLHRRASVVAAYHGLTLADFLDRHLRPVVDKLYGEMGRAIQDEAD